MGKCRPEQSVMVEKKGNTLLLQYKLFTGITETKVELTGTKDVLDGLAQNSSLKGWWHYLRKSLYI